MVVKAGKTLEDWRDNSPVGFVLAANASFDLTLKKKFRDSAEPLGRLLERAMEKIRET